ncbi:V-type ATPase subunit [Alkalibaculum bacchi]|mgnify:CR=1 FL=1|uniref:V-type ATPase subunit n=1 Tax=Alkalibaculum bacchi TaxID=645887 RepID=UPI0026F159E6|nr:V-type ATPase subunit [Alkalibaculum bacchi]
MNFSTVNTKISAMKARLLSKEDFINIMNLQSVQEVFDYLNENTSLRDVLWDLNGRKVHRNDFERRLYRYKILVVEKLMPYLNQDYKDLIKKYMLRYEIENLKLVFEVVRGRKKMDDIKDHFFTFGKYSNIDFKKLLEKDSVLEVLEQIKDTKYYRLILPYAQNQDDEKFNFYVEMMLDKYYYHQLIQSAQKFLGDKDKKSTELLRRRVDLYNLEWFYRGMKYFDMSKEEILNFVLDYGYLYNYNKLRDLIYKIDLHNLVEQFIDTPYEFLFDYKNDLDLFMERRIDRYLYNKSISLFNNSILSFGKVSAFMELIDFQIEDVISIIESKRYKMPAEEISKYLIRTIEVVE